MLNEVDAKTIGRWNEAANDQEPAAGSLPRKPKQVDPKILAAKTTAIANSIRIAKQQVEELRALTHDKHLGDSIVGLESARKSIDRLSNQN